MTIRPPCNRYHVFAIRINGSWCINFWSHAINAMKRGVEGGRREGRGEK